ncbi:g8801 [Coccomyxa elongata]
MSKLQELVKKYGKVAIGVHLGIYAATLAGCYVAAERKLNLEHYLVKYNLLKEEDLRADGDPADRSWLAKVLTSSGSSFAIAFVCTKALLPVRLPLTVAVTPAVARIIHPRAVTSTQQAAKNVGRTQ